MDITLIDLMNELNDAINRTVKEVKQTLLNNIKNILKQYEKLITHLNIKKQLVKINKIQKKEFNSKNKVMYQSIRKYTLSSMQDRREIYLLKQYVR